MRQPPTYTTWRITCQSPADAQALQQWLASRIDLDRVVTDTVRTISNGVEQVQLERHRLGDYFTGIHISPDALANPATFRLTFHRRAEAGRFWKDLMVNLLREIDASGRTSAVDLDSKGEMAPLAAVANVA